MTDTYYDRGDIASHICPVCRMWCLEAPEAWDLDELEEILGEHFLSCQLKAWGVNA